jgi:hypothetical protein
MLVILCLEFFPNSLKIIPFWAQDCHEVKVQSCFDLHITLVALARMVSGGPGSIDASCLAAWICVKVLTVWIFRSKASSEFVRPVTHELPMIFLMVIRHNFEYGFI